MEGGSRGPELAAIVTEKLLLDSTARCAYMYIYGTPSLSHTMRLGVVYELSCEAPQEAHDGWLLT